jgi:hypothetical protein
MRGQKAQKSTQAHHLALLNVQQGFDRGLGTEGYRHIGGWISYPSSQA